MRSSTTRGICSSCRSMSELQYWCNVDLCHPCIEAQLLMRQSFAMQKSTPLRTAFTFYKMAGHCVSVLRFLLSSHVLEYLLSTPRPTYKSMNLLESASDVPPHNSDLQKSTNDTNYLSTSKVAREFRDLIDCRQSLCTNEMEMSALLDHTRALKSLHAVLDQTKRNLDIPDSSAHSQESESLWSTLIETWAVVKQHMEEPSKNVRNKTPEHYRGRHKERMLPRSHPKAPRRTCQPNGSITPGLSRAVSHLQTTNLSTPHEPPCSSIKEPMRRGRRLCRTGSDLPAHTTVTDTCLNQRKHAYRRDKHNGPIVTELHGCLEHPAELPASMPEPEHSIRTQSPQARDDINLHQQHHLSSANKQRKYCTPQSSHSQRSCLPKGLYEASTFDSESSSSNTVIPESPPLLRTLHYYHPYCMLTLQRDRKNHQCLLILFMLLMLSNRSIMTQTSRVSTRSGPIQSPRPAGLL